VGDQMAFTPDLELRGHMYAFQDWESASCCRCPRYIQVPVSLGMRESWEQEWQEVGKERMSLMKAAKMVCGGMYVRVCVCWGWARCTLLQCMLKLL
jgi:hypothetical protein